MPPPGSKGARPSLRPLFLLACLLLLCQFGRPASVSPPTAPSAGSPPQPTGLAATHRSGQAFITWTERADLTAESYRLYHHRQPITADNLD